MTEVGAALPRAALRRLALKVLGHGAIPVLLYLGYFATVFGTRERRGVFQVEDGVGWALVSLLAWLIVKVGQIEDRSRCSLRLVAPLMRWWGVWRMTVVGGACGTAYLAISLVLVETGSSQFLAPSVSSIVSAGFLQIALLRAVCSGFFEEVIFRGSLLPAITIVWGWRWGVVLSSLMFGALHGADRLPLAFLVGVGMAWLLRRTGTIWSSVAAHIAIDLVVIFVIPAVVSRVGVVGALAMALASAALSLIGWRWIWLRGLLGQRGWTAAIRDQMQPALDC